MCIRCEKDDTRTLSYPTDLSWTQLSRIKPDRCVSCEPRTCGNVKLYIITFFQSCAVTLHETWPVMNILHSYIYLHLFLFFFSTTLQNMAFQNHCSLVLTGFFLRYVFLNLKYFYFCYATYHYVIPLLIMLLRYTLCATVFPHISPVFIMAVNTFIICSTVNKKIDEELNLIFCSLCWPSWYLKSQMLLF